MLVSTQNRVDVTVNGPAGWTLVNSGSDAGTTIQTYVWTKVATAADAGANVSVTNSDFTKTTLQVVAYSGVGSISAQNLAFDAALGAAHSTPTVRGRRQRQHGVVGLDRPDQHQHRLDPPGRCDAAVPDRRGGQRPHDDRDRIDVVGVGRKLGRLHRHLAGERPARRHVVDRPRPRLITEDGPLPEPDNGEGRGSLPFWNRRTCRVAERGRRSTRCAGFRNPIRHGS